MNNDLPGVPKQTLAERFQRLMRAPGRVITILSDSSVIIHTEEDDIRLTTNARAACGILNVSMDVVGGRGETFRLTRLPK